MAKYSDRIELVTSVQRNVSVDLYEIDESRYYLQYLTIIEGTLIKLFNDYLTILCVKCRYFRFSR